MPTTTKEFSVVLVSIVCSAPFAYVVKRISETFGQFDGKKAQALVESGDVDAFTSYVAGGAGDHDFAIFFALDQGSAMTLMGDPTLSYLFLIGNAVTAAGLFKFEAGSGLFAPLRVCVAERDGTTFIEYDLPSSLAYQYDTLLGTPVPPVLDQKLRGYLEAIASEAVQS